MMGGFHPHTAETTVHDAVDTSVHILLHVAGTGRAGPAGQVARGSGYRHLGRLDEGQGYRVVGTADSHSVQASRGDVGHIGTPLEDHSERSRPKALCQPVCCRRNIPAVPSEPGHIRNMEDQGIILRPALGLEDVGHRLRVQAIGAQAIDRLRGDSQEASPADDLRRRLDLLPLSCRIGDVENLCFHSVRFALFCVYAFSSPAEASLQPGRRR